MHRRPVEATARPAAKSFLHHGDREPRPEVIPVRMLALVALLIVTSSPLMAQIDLSDPAEPWLETAFGVTQEVPPPFEPVTVDGANASVWGREYALAGPLPAQMTSQGEPLLAAPMRLVLEAGGEQHVLAGGDVSVDLLRHDRVEFSSTSEVGGFTVSAANWLEYDGVIQVNLTVSGQGTIDRLALEIAIAPERALYLHEHAQWGGYDYLAIPEDANWTRSKGWHAQTWIGDDYRGLTFVTEHPGDLKGPTESQIEYERTPDAVIFRANLLGEPTEIDGEMTWTLGLQASPGKPLPLGWHGRHVGNMGPGGAEGAQVLLDRGQNISLVWNTEEEFFSYPQAANPQELKATIDAYHEAGIRSVIYITLSGTGPSEVFGRHRDEWLMSIEDGKPLFGDEEVYTSTCPNSTYTDWLVWAVDQAMAEYDLDGVYIDNPGPYYCTNAAHGCDSTRGRTYPYFANRDLHKRLWNVIRARKPEAGLVWEHNSRTSNTFQLTFCDIYSDGEHFRVKSKGEITDITIPFLEITGTGRQFGSQPCFLPSALNVREEWSQWLVGRLLPFGNNMMMVPSWLDQSVLAGPLRAQLEFGLDTQPVEWFTPEQTPAWLPVKRGEGVLVGGYRREDNAVLLSAYNATEEKTQVRFDLRPLEAAAGGEVAGRDALSDAPCTRLGNDLVISIPAYDYRMVVLEAR